MTRSLRALSRLLFKRVTVTKHFRSSLIMSLTLSSTLSPFPYAAAALATYTKQAELVFDDTVADVALDLSGTVISGEEKIIEELAKVGGLSSDSTAV